MNFSDNIPERLVAVAPSKFVQVLDGVQNEKQLIIASALRENNPLLLNDPKWLILRLADYGLTGIPQELPVVILQQVLLNAGTLLRLRGSKMGLELFCSIFSLGEVTYDDSAFYALSQVIWPNSIIEGFITADNVNPYFHLLDDSDQIAVVNPLDITIETPFYNNEVVKSFIEIGLSAWLGFSPGLSLSFTWIERDSAYFHPLLNSYFVNS